MVALSEVVPCRKCLKRPCCSNRETIVCTDLFLTIIRTGEFFDSDNMMKECWLKTYIKDIFSECKNVVPGEEFKRNEYTM